MPAKIRKGDTVEVLAGKSKGTRGTVLRVDHERKKVLVERVNIVKRHQKPSAVSRQGGIIEKEAPIDISNVMLVCPQTNQPTRVGVRVLEDGSKERFSKRSGASLGQISGPKTARTA